MGKAFNKYRSVGLLIRNKNIYVNAKVVFLSAVKTSDQNEAFNFINNFELLKQL